MPMLKTMTIKEFLKKVEKAGAVSFKDTKVFVCNPYEDGIGFDLLPVSDVHVSDGSVHIQVPVKKEYE